MQAALLGRPAKQAGGDGSGDQDGSNAEDEDDDDAAGAPAAARMAAQAGGDGSGDQGGSNAEDEDDDDAAGTAAAPLAAHPPQAAPAAHPPQAAACPAPGAGAAHARANIVRPPNVEPNIDDDDDSAIANDSIMGVYLKAVFMRLKYEVSHTVPALERKWLTDMLKDNDYWVLSARAKEVCKTLNLNIYTEETKYYFRDIKVWLPDVPFGDEKGTPPCGCCGSAANVVIHGFRDNYFGRRVLSLDGHYFVISRRYKCTTCEKEAKELRSAALRVAQAAGLGVLGADHDGADDDGADDEDQQDLFPNDSDAEEQGEGGQAHVRRKPPSYTFMAHDARSLQLLPHGYGNDFPAVLTWRAGVDKRIVDLLRPLSDKGVRHAAISEILLELHTKAYWRTYEKREHLLAVKMESGLFQPGDFPMFSTFQDPSKYAGAVPTGRYLSSVYKQYARTISHHLANEVT